jgi:hypothetical protein
MSTEPTPDLVVLLEESRQELNDAALQKANATPVAQGWNAAQCLEHVTFTEDRLLARLAAAQPQQTAGGSRAAELAGRVDDRSTRLQAPDVAQPQGKFSTVEEALAAFNAVRTRTIELARARESELPFLSVEHPRFGTVNGVGLLVLMAGHARRHAAQIRELPGA